MLKKIAEPLKKALYNLLHFFPVQLLLLYLKKNHALLVVWLVLLGYVTELLAQKYGIPYLFLAPEYFHRVNERSFFLLGVSAGIFIMAFNITSYVVNGYLFPFIATISRPFVRFTLNNFPLPLIFLATFGVSSYNYQLHQELIAQTDVIRNLTSFYLGVGVFIIFSFSYFFSINIRFFKRLGISSTLAEPKALKPIQQILQKDAQWKIQNIPLEYQSHWYVGHYLSNPFRISPTKNYRHYSANMIQKVLSKNNKNAALYSLLIIGLTLSLGFSIRNDFTIIPAGASIMLLLAVIILATGAFYSVFKEWSFIFLILLVFAINQFSKSAMFTYQQSAYGLNYEAEITDNTPEDFVANINADKQQMRQILFNWKYKNQSKYRKRKPKIVFVNTNGGGLKAALWTYHSLAYADSITNGKLLNHTFLITGASGGMLGASYLREMYLRFQNQQIHHLYSDSIANFLSKDLLNPVLYGVATHDWFFRLQQFEYNRQKYFVDRAYLFEKNLNINTNSVLDKPLIAYKSDEYEARIPLIIFSPAIIDYGNQMLISAQDIAFLCNSKQLNLTTVTDLSPVEFRRKYKAYNADSLRFTTAIRMNASFPYVSPVVEMPGNDRLKVMDAGVHDNYGMTTSLRFVENFTDWINKYTSGVIIIQITEINQKKPENEGFIAQFTKPISGVLDNFFYFQQIKIEEKANTIQERISQPVYFMNFYLKSQNKDISLSWHLTNKEKAEIKEALRYKENQIAFKNLQLLLDALPNE